MVRSLRSALFAGIGLVLAACGGGGGSSTSISVTPASLSFTATTEDSQKASDVTAYFKGDGVVVGYPPEAVIPNWLYVEERNYTSSHATFAVIVSPSGLAPGTYATTLRFLTGRVDSQGNVSAIKHDDLPVSLTVAELALSPAVLNLEAAHGATTSLTGALTLQIANGQAWTAADDRPWLTVEPSGAGAGLVDYTINPSGLALGVHSATITVTGPAQLTDTATVYLTVRAPRLTANPAAPSFTVATANASATLEQTLHVSDELGGDVPGSAIAWTLQSITAPWLQMTPTSGSSAPGVDATLSLVESQLATMANATYTAYVVLAYTDAGGQARTLTIPVTLTLNSPLQSISVTPSAVGRLVAEQAVQFAAAGTYATGYSGDVTSDVTWSSSNVATADVGNGGALAKGRSRPLAPGVATITAALPGTDVSGTATFTVTAPLGYAYVSAYYASTLDQYIFGADGELKRRADQPSVATQGAVGRTLFSPSGEYAYLVTGNGIRQYTVGAGGSLEPMATVLVPGSANTGGIAVDPAGENLYATAYDPASSQYRIRHYSIAADGSLTLVSGTTPGIPYASQPQVLPTGGYLYVLDSSYTIARYALAADGTPTPAGTNSGPTRDFALHPSGGAAYALDQYNVYQYTVGADGALAPMSPAGVPVGGQSSDRFVVNAAGTHAYAIDSYSNIIRHYTIGADLKLTVDSTVSTVDFQPIDVALEPSGQYLYISTQHGLVYKFTLDADGDIVGEPTYTGVDQLARGFAVLGAQ